MQTKTDTCANSGIAFSLPGRNPYLHQLKRQSSVMEEFTSSETREGKGQ